MTSLSPSLNPEKSQGLGQRELKAVSAAGLGQTDRQKEGDRWTAQAWTGRVAGR